MTGGRRPVGSCKLYQHGIQHGPQHPLSAYVPTWPSTWTNPSFHSTWPSTWSSTTSIRCSITWIPVFHHINIFTGWQGPPADASKVRRPGALPASELRVGIQRVANKDTNRALIHINLGLMFCFFLFIPQQVLSGIFATTKLNRCTYEKPSKCLTCLEHNPTVDWIPIPQSENLFNSKVHRKVFILSLRRTFYIQIQPYVIMSFGYMHVSTVKF